jgi:cysteine desulfurase
MFFKETYLDSGATTQVDELVLKKMIPYYTDKYGNASSEHTKGFEAKEALEDARRTIAKAINASPEEIIFTSGGTESNNFAIKGIAFSHKEKGNHIIVSNVEHKCIINACKWLETQGFEVTYLPVDAKGFIQPEALEAAINDRTILFSVIHGNNEIGTIQDMEALGKICKTNNVHFHTDACQSFTKTELDVKKFYLDLVTLNAHKINGPKGVGALYIKKGTKITPLLHGGGQEDGERAGTENIPGIVGFAEATKISNNPKHRQRMTKLRDHFIEEVLKIDGTKLNGADGDQRLCNNMNILFKDVDGDLFSEQLDKNMLCTSKASACSTHTSEPSYVLMALGLSGEDADRSVRFTLSRLSTDDDVEKALAKLPKIVEKSRKKGFFDKVAEKFDD